MSENDTTKNEAEEPKVAEVAAEEEIQIPHTVKEVKPEAGSVLRYSVEIERQSLDEKIADILADLNESVVIEGFRRGKAPLRLLKNRYGKEAEENALRDLASDIGKLIIKKDSLDAIGDPELFESKAETGQPIELIIDIDVQPKVEASGYTGIEVEVESAEVTDEMVERQLEMIRNANATYEEVKEADRAFAQGDGATVDITVVDKNGQVVENRSQENLFLRDPLMSLPPEIAAELPGKKQGDVITKTITHQGRNKAGADISYEETHTVTIKEIKTRVVPNMDDEFAKDVGDFENLGALRKRILDDLTDQQDRSKRTQAMDKIFDKLLEANPFDAPRKVVAAQEYQTIMRDSERLQRMGLDFSAMGMSTEGYLAHARSNAERLVKMQLIIQAVAEKEKLEVTDEDVEKEIERRAEESGRKPLAVRARLEAEKRLDSLKQDLMLQKVEDFLYESNTIKAVEPKAPAEAESGEEKKES